MLKQPIQMTATGALLAAVWIASCFLAWNVEPTTDFGLLSTAVFIFRFLPMIAAIGALFGRPLFGAIMGICTAFALLSLEVGCVLLFGA
jgi:hypothetical protein